MHTGLNADDDSEGGSDEDSVPWGSMPSTGRSNISGDDDDNDDEAQAGGSGEGGAGDTHPETGHESGGSARGSAGSAEDARGLQRKLFE